VISGTFPAKARRRLDLLVIAFCGFVLLPGCEPDPYPSNLTYPVRTDLLVEQANEEGIAETFAPGQLDVFLADLKNKAKDKPNTFTVLDPVEGLTARQRQDIRAAPGDVFGKPGAPRVTLSSEAEMASELLLDGEVLGKGSVLYRRHCLHCHGVAGDGHGPTAPWLNPPPRDFRRGLFKFTSVVASGVSKPTRSDLVRTLREGIEGTAMPTFKYLKDEELDALVSYVMHLSIRGMTEYTAMKKQIDANRRGSGDAPNVYETVDESSVDYTRQWKEEAKPITPLEYPKEYDDPAKFTESVRRGHQLFVGAGECLKCHTDYGRQATFRYDKWGTLVRPRNLVEGVYRGGRRPVDLYYRLAGGVLPSEMPKAPDTVTANARDIWDLVNFVRSLPYPAMLPDDVRDKVYGPTRR